MCFRVLNSSSIFNRYDFHFLSNLYSFILFLQLKFTLPISVRFKDYVLIPNFEILIPTFSQLNH